MKNFPFDPYDFFGYIASGVIVVIGLEIALGFPKVLGEDLTSFEFIALSLAVYVAGQIVATPAKWILEIIIVKRILKPPSFHLVKKNKPLWAYLLLGYSAPLPNSTIDKIIDKAKSEGLDILVGDEALMARLKSFLNKYGFSRNLSFTCFLFSGLIYSNLVPDASTVDIKYAWLALIVGIFLFFRYLKFFRQYSYELFNSYAGK